MNITITIPTPATLLRRSRWLIFGLLVLVLVLIIGHSSVQRTGAAGAGEMSLSVKAGDFSCDDPAKPTKCDVGIGTSFTLSVSVNTLPVSAGGIPGYTMFATQIVYDGLSYKKAADPCTEISWPDGLAACIRFQNLGLVGHIDFTALDPQPPVSTHIGNIVDITLNCPATPDQFKVALPVFVPVLNVNGSLFGDAILADFVPKSIGTQDVDINGDTIPETLPVADTLLINCVLLKSEINILKQNVQVPLPDSCFEVRDEAQNPLFMVCDNDFQGADSHPVCNADTTPVCEDSDPADGSIRVSVDPGNYNVVEVKPPPGHVLNTSKLPCDAKTAKCDLVFKNASISNPWFPWDLNGDKAVAFADFLILLQHFNTQK